jgi:hypothetical protein
VRIYGLLPLFVPAFATFAGVAGYELAAGRPVNRWHEMLRGIAYAPASLWKHARSRRPAAREWLRGDAAGEER